MQVVLVGLVVIVFIAVVGVRALMARWRVKQIPDGPLPPLPGDIVNNAANPEVYSLAYLRAGTRGVAQVALLGLLRRGVLESAGGSLYPAGPRPNALFLQPLESALLDFVGAGKRWPAIVRPGDLKTLLEAHCLPFRQHFEQIGLLAPGEEFDGRNRRRRRAYLDAIEAACPTGAVLPAQPGGGPPPLLAQDRPLLLLALHGPKPLLSGMYAEFASHWMTQGSGTTRNEYEEESGGFFVFSGGGSDDSSSSSSSSSDSDSSSVSYSSSDD